MAFRQFAYSSTSHTDFDLPHQNDTSSNKLKPELSLKDSATAVVIQSIGPVSALLVVVFVARFYGVEAQGVFTTLRALLDLLLVLFAFGMSSSLSYIINRLNTPKFQLTIYASCFGMSVYLTCWLTLSLINNSGLLTLPNTESNVIIFMALACAFGVTVDLWRGVLLALTDGPVYSFCIVLQPVILLTVIGFSSFNTASPTFTLYFCIANILATLITGFFLINRLEKSRHFQSPNIFLKDLLSKGFQSLLQNVFLTLVPFTSIWLIQIGGWGTATVGLWGIAALVFQAIASPTVMIAPLLFNRWTKSDPVDVIHHARSLSRTVLLVSIPFTAFVAYTTYHLVPVIFGKPFVGAVPAATIMTLCFPALLITRIFAAAIFAVGEAFFLTLLLGLRFILVLLAGLVTIGSSEAKVLTTLAISWLASEIVLAIISWYWGRKKLTQQSQAHN